MQNSKPLSRPRRIGILLFDGFSNFCLANAVEPLRAANALARRPLYDWQFLGPTDAALTSSSGLPVQPERFCDAATGDYLFVMPSYGHDALATPQMSRRLRAAAHRYGTMVGLDTGAWLMAQAGMLDGRRATAHWDILTDLEEAFPDIDTVQDRFVIDGDRATCGGATTTLDLMLHLIEQHHGVTLSLEVAALFMFGEREPRANLVEGLPDHRIVQAAAAQMRRHIEDPLPIAEVAARVGLGQRALEAVFRKHAGQRPARLYRSIRLAEARRRVEQSRSSVAEIALRSGYRDATAMTRAFKAEFGMAPTALRRRLSASMGETGE